MARPDPVAFGEKYDRVQQAVEAAHGAERRHFDFTGEVEPGVRLVLSEAGGTPLAFSLWTLPAGHRRTLQRRERAGDGRAPRDRRAAGPGGHGPRASPSTSRSSGAASPAPTSTTPCSTTRASAGSTRLCTGSSPLWSRTRSPPDRPVVLLHRLQDRDAVFDLPSGSPAAAPRESGCAAAVRLSVRLMPGAHVTQRRPPYALLA